MSCLRFFLVTRPNGAALSLVKPPGTSGNSGSGCASAFEGLALTLGDIASVGPLTPSSKGKLAVALCGDLPLFFARSELMHHVADLRTLQPQLRKAINQDR